jgi:hypothetical protein
MKMHPAYAEESLSKFQAANVMCEVNGQRSIRLLDSIKKPAP